MWKDVAVALLPPSGSSCGSPSSFFGVDVDGSIPCLGEVSKRGSCFFGGGPRMKSSECVVDRTIWTGTLGGEFLGSRSSVCGVDEGL
jgi:hypothetical protein